MRFVRSIVVAASCGATTVAVMHGCGSGLGQVTVQELSSTKPHLSTITAERLQQCVTDHGGELQPGRHYFSPVVEVDQDGRKLGVSTPDMPDTAPDLAACTRIALSDMAIPASVFNMRATQSASTTEPTVEQRSLVGNPAVVVVVVVGLSEIVLEAGAITILFATTVKVVDKAKDDVLDLARRRPKPNKNRCFDAAAGGEYLWEEFCRSMPNPGDCWSKTLESEQNKRGWCNEKFGWW